MKEACWIKSNNSHYSALWKSVEPGIMKGLLFFAFSDFFGRLSKIENVLLHPLLFNEYFLSSLFRRIPREFID